MLLVPINTDVHHQDATYAETNDGPDNPSKVASEDGANRDAVLLSIPALKPSKALLAGEVGFVDDDEDESMSDDVGSSVGAESLAVKESDIAPKEWEDISRPVALQAEIEAAVHLLATQQAWDDLHLSTSSREGGERAPQGLQGKWGATIVFRHASVPGMLYVFEQTIVFQGESNPKEDSSEWKPALPVRHGEQTWRWRLERLTQVTDLSM